MADLDGFLVGADLYGDGRSEVINWGIYNGVFGGVTVSLGGDLLYTRNGDVDNWIITPRVDVPYPVRLLGGGQFGAQQLVLSNNENGWTGVFEWDKNRGL